MAGVISSYNTTRHMSYVKNQRHAARNDLLTQTFSRPTNVRPLSKSVETNKKNTKQNDDRKIYSKWSKTKS